MAYESEGQAKLNNAQQALLNEVINNRWEELQIRTGMAETQHALINESQNTPEAEKPFFNRFHSFLRYFNANTPIDAFKSAFISPIINFLGRILNFASDEDCELVAELFTSSNNLRARPTSTLLGQSTTWQALLKVFISIPGALIRAIASVTDFVLDAVFSPIRTAKNIWAGLNNPLQFFNHLTRHYQIETSNIIPEDSTNTDEIRINVLTINVCMLRSWFWSVFKNKDHNGNTIPFNKIKPPKERIDDLINDLVERAKDRDVICLQELFDNLSYLGFGKDSQQKLIDALKPHFPHMVYDVGHRSWPLVGSGLMILSKHPILEVDYFRYPNLRGADILSNKGCVGAKIAVGNRFFTVYNTHIQAGEGLPTKWMETLTRKKKLGGASDLRNEELGMIHEHYLDWARTPPQAAPTLHYGDTFLMGDINQGLNNFNKVYGISHGKKDRSALGPRVLNQIKYGGQNRLMHDFSVHLADNFVDCRFHGRPKHIKKDEGRTELLKQVKKDMTEEIIEELLSNPSFAGVEETLIREEVRKHFAVYTGSIISGYHLMGSLMAKTEPLLDEHPLNDDCDNEKYVDACFAADFDRPNKLQERGLYALERRCLLFSPKGKNDLFYTDHAGVTGDFSYTKDY